MRCWQTIGLVVNMRASTAVGSDQADVAASTLAVVCRPASRVMIRADKARTRTALSAHIGR